jgi:prepilin-type N-terminal cleavage/methylation domain-containing protein
MSARFTKLGFTLIELLVVISIIGILATLVSANLNAARSRARDAERKSDTKSIQTGLRLYYNDNGSYPPSNYFDSLWGAEWKVGTTMYMNAVPKDPVSSQTYLYELGTDTDNYTFSACLENASDAQGILATGAYAAWCPGTKWIFQVKQ